MLGRDFGCGHISISNFGSGLLWGSFWAMTLTPLPSWVVTSALAPFWAMASVAAAVRPHLQLLLTVRTQRWLWPNIRSLLHLQLACLGGYCGSCPLFGPWLWFSPTWAAALALAPFSAETWLQIHWAEIFSSVPILSSNISAGPIWPTSLAPAPVWVVPLPKSWPLASVLAPSLAATSDPS